MIYLSIISIILNLILLMFIVSLNNRVTKLEDKPKEVSQPVLKTEEKIVDSTPKDLDTLSIELDEILSTKSKDEIDAWLEKPQKRGRPKKIENEFKQY